MNSSVVNSALVIILSLDNDANRNDRCARMPTNATLTDVRNTVFPGSAVSFYKLNPSKDLSASDLSLQHYKKILKDEEINVLLRDFNYTIHYKSGVVSQPDESTPLVGVKKGNSDGGFKESLKSWLCIAGPLFAEKRNRSSSA